MPELTACYLLLDERVRRLPEGGPRTAELDELCETVRQEHRAQLFDPFFTTKKNGVGLGLAISRSLVEAQGGELALGEPMRGAEFQVTLPRAGAS